MKHFPDLPPVWTFVFGLLQWLIARSLPAYGIDLPGWIGGVVILAGLALVGWSALRFLRHRTPIEPRHDPKYLIVSGPYRFTRNPIYLAMAVVLTGWALWLGSLPALVAVPVFCRVITLRFIRSEEDALRRAFGPEAERFLAGTPRWIIR